MQTTPTGRRTRRQLRARPLPPDLDADLAVRVATAALAEHPGAVVDRVEADSADLFAVHLVTCYGDRVVVQVDGDLTVLGWLALAR
ncbi:hypothetical protein DQ238_07700 [Geodermatophilus sp. TF02-6]|uniref:hypothetical protein n=1 Tax=Geodermatophilus sp. TF02-6 TaxID=2250575 RepID=UPI000DE9C5D6|nr:hypothetical protein [Geodermatophilus sp. TF02-6]RBY80915.1 hypothetical protein DQ238_07700 [Geodermatophilus sp. TF02-6]